MLGWPTFFKLALKQKLIAARYTNHPLVSIRSQYRFLIQAGKPSKMAILIVLGWPTFFKLA